MKMFGKKKIKVEHYDRENLRPVIRASICTGEQVAGFKNIHTGKFEDVMLIRDNRDIEEFLQRYDIAADEVTKEY
ncbi:MAG: aspartate dehydrogenase [Lachnospiraceae bacterium]|nr:aspartate dehydrogenase [Lachnospiraceae bacterium]